ncbi:hypothetical protein RvY_05182 [Ramazzottius varieornatus]|uniref:Protein kinase domain-containing protein n=1 Tax=Ramazzottius varieornatus TaxID=947166 RepID=A0A1D1UU93_RAMVA|nr:hypothetical protein RvY_05182 [Ramazzottius varieornatus]
MDENSDWDMTKENIRPIRQGRAAESASFAEIVDPKHSTDLKQKRAELEAAIESYQGDDPLANWITLIDWIESVYPKGGAQAGLTQVLKKCANKFFNEGKRSKRYFDDPRFLRVWIKLASHGDAIKTYQFMSSHELGHLRSEMYIEWARELESKNNIAEAEKVLERGLSFCASDAEHKAKLEHARRLIFDRNARNLFESNITEALATEEDRNMLGGLRPVGREKKTAPINRIGDSKILSKPVVSSRQTKVQTAQISIHSTENGPSPSADPAPARSPPPTELPFLLTEPDRENLVSAVKLAKSAANSVRKPQQAASSTHLGFQILADPEEPIPSDHLAEPKVIKRPLAYRKSDKESPAATSVAEVPVENLWDVEKYNDPSPSTRQPSSQEDDRKGTGQPAPPPSTTTMFAWHYQLFLSGADEYTFEENLAKRVRKKRQAEAAAREKQVEQNIEEKERLLDEKLREAEAERQAAVELRESLEREVKSAEEVRMKAESLWNDAEEKLSVAEEIRNNAETAQREAEALREEAEQARAEAQRLQQVASEERANSETMLQEAKDLRERVREERELCAKMRTEAEEMNRTVEDDLLLCESILQIASSCLTSLKADVEDEDVNLVVGLDNFLSRLQRKLGSVAAEEHKSTGIASVNMMLVVLEELRESLMVKYAQEPSSTEEFAKNENLLGSPLARDLGENFGNGAALSFRAPREETGNASCSWQSSQPVSILPESQRKATNSKIYAMWNQSVVGDVSREKSAAENWPLPDPEEPQYLEPVRQAIALKRKNVKSLQTSAAADPENANYSVNMETSVEEDQLIANPVKVEQPVFQIFRDKSVEDGSSVRTTIHPSIQKPSPVTQVPAFAIFQDLSSIRHEKSFVPKDPSVLCLSVSQDSFPSEIPTENTTEDQPSIPSTNNEFAEPISEISSYDTQPPESPSQAWRETGDNMPAHLNEPEGIRESRSPEISAVSRKSLSPEVPSTQNNTAPSLETNVPIPQLDATSPLSSQESNYTCAPTQPLSAPTFFTANCSNLEGRVKALSLSAMSGAMEYQKVNEFAEETSHEEEVDASEVFNKTTFHEPGTSYTTARAVDVRATERSVLEVQESTAEMDNKQKIEGTKDYMKEDVEMEEKQQDDDGEKETENGVQEDAVEDESMAYLERQGHFAMMQDEFNQTRKSFGFAEQTFQIGSETQFVSAVNQRYTSTPRAPVMAFDEEDDEEQIDNGQFRRRPQPRPSYVASHYKQELSPIVERSRENKTSSSSGSSGTATHLRFSKKSTINCSPLKEHDEAHPIDPYSLETVAGMKDRIFRMLDEDDNVQRITDEQRVKEKMEKIEPKVVIKLAGQKYKIGEALGDGNYAVVYSLHHRSNSSISWAMKVQKSHGWWDYYIHSTILRRVHELPEGELYLQYIIRAISFHQFEDGMTLTLLPLFEEGHLVTLINRFQKSPEKTLPELLAMKLSIDILRAVEGLHAVNIIHGDIKADNFLVQDSKGLISDKVQTIEDLLALPTLVLTDFGCGIDVSLFSPTVTFSTVKKGKTTSGYEILSSKPWTYQIDLLGILDVMHCLLFGDYMKLHEQAGIWRISKSFKRSWSGIWQRTFQRLLNIESCDDIPCLTELRKEFEHEARTHFKSSEVPKLLRNARVSLFMQRKSCFIQN